MFWKNKNRIKRILAVTATVGLATIPLTQGSLSGGTQTEINYQRNKEETVSVEATTVIDTTGVNTSTIIAYQNKVVGVPPAPKGSKWQYGLTTEPWSDTPPTNMKPGDVVEIRLTLLSPKTSRFNVPVYERLLVNDQIYVGDIDLSNILALPSGDLYYLPKRPAHTYWMYKYDDGNWGRFFVMWQPFRHVHVKLQAEEGYALSQVLERDVLNGNIKPTDASAFDMSKVVAVAGEGGIAHLPKILPDAMHWEYKMPGSDWSDHLVAKLTPGMEISIVLVVTGNIELNRPVTKTVVVQEYKIPVPEIVTLDKVVIHVSGVYDNMPTAPASTHWEFSLNGSDWTTVQPPGPFPGKNYVSIRLVSNYDFQGLSRKLERDMIEVVE